jgi:hypothetical protein
LGCGTAAIQIATGVAGCYKPAGQESSGYSDEVDEQFTVSDRRGKWAELLTALG